MKINLADIPHFSYRQSGRRAHDRQLTQIHEQINANLVAHQDALTKET